MPARAGTDQTGRPGRRHQGRRSGRGPASRAGTVGTEGGVELFGSALGRSAIRPAGPTAVTATMVGGRPSRTGVRLPCVLVAAGLGMPRHIGRFRVELS